MKRLAVCLALVLLVWAVPCVMAQNNQNQSNGIFAPNGYAYGMTYPEWSAAWWRWVTSMPSDTNPLNDAAPCSEGQLGRVWFLGGAFGSHAQYERSCTIPAGTALFFPIVNVDCSSLEVGDFYGATPADRQACLDKFAVIDKLVLKVDGVPVKGLQKYIFRSPDVSFLVPMDANNNVLGVPGGYGHIAGIGAYVLLAPLEKGEHTIYWSGTLEIYPYTSTQLYHITVAGTK